MKDCPRSWLFRPIRLWRGNAGTYGSSLRRAESGDAVGIAFTTVEKLIEQLGRFQPRIVMRSDYFRQLLAAVPVTTIALDPHVAGVAPQWSSEAVDALMEVNDVGV